MKNHLIRVPKIALPDSEVKRRTNVAIVLCRGALVRLVVATLSFIVVVSFCASGTSVWGTARTRGSPSIDRDRSIDCLHCFLPRSAVVIDRRAEQEHRCCAVVETMMDSQLFIVVETECVDRNLRAGPAAAPPAADSKTPSPSNTSSADHDAAATAAWNEAMAANPIHCDIFLEQAPSIIITQQQQQQQHPSSSVHNENDYNNLLFENLQHYPNQPLNPCGNDNLLVVEKPNTPTAISTSATTSATTMHLSLTRCHLQHSGSTNKDIGQHDFVQEQAEDPPLSFAPPNTTTQDDDANNNDHSSAGFDFYLPVTPVPHEFSWTVAARADSSAAHDAIHHRIEMDLTNAKNLFLLAWDERRRSRGNEEEEEAVSNATSNFSSSSDGSNENAKDDAPTMDSPPAVPLPVIPPQCPSSKLRAPSADATRNFQELLHANLQDRHSHSTLFKENMETMMKRELSDINAMLAIMAVFAVVLALFMGWTARQIAQENKIKRSGSGSKSQRYSSTVKEGAGETKRQMPVSMVACVDGRFSTNDGTVSPLTLEPALGAATPTNVLQTVEATSPCTGNSPSRSPCSQLQTQWWHKQAAIRGRHNNSNMMMVTADEDSTVSDGTVDAGDVQRFLVPEPAHKHTTKHPSHSNGENEENQHYILNAVRKHPAIAPRRIFPPPHPTVAVKTGTGEAACLAANQSPTALAPTPTATTHKVVVSPDEQDASSSSLQLLQEAKIDPNAEGLKDCSNQRPAAAPPIPGMAPTHSSSFIEDYW